VSALQRIGLGAAVLVTALQGCSDGSSGPSPNAGGTPSTGGAAGSGQAGASTSPSGGVAGTSAPTAGTSSSTSGAGGGVGGSALAGSGGMAGTSPTSGGNAGAGGGSGGSSGAGGGSADGWVKIFNGTDLTGWVPLIHKWKYNEDPYKTFRVDAGNPVIRVTYEDYPGQDFDDHCGLLYYDKPLKDYRVRLTYRFLEPQAKNRVPWGKNNTGLMVFATDPKTVTNDPEFPPLIEIQLLGTPSGGGKNNANLCQPGGMRVSKLFGQSLSDSSCHDSQSGTAPPAAQWVTVEAEVHVSGDTKVFQYPNMTTPVLTFSGPVYNGQAVTGGYLALQSESQPVEYKDIELKELP
jgi:hypothetical protein